MFIYVSTYACIFILTKYVPENMNLVFNDSPLVGDTENIPGKGGALTTTTTVDDDDNPPIYKLCFYIYINLYIYVFISISVFLCLNVHMYMNICK
jgi:hypothetical protein